MDRTIEQLSVEWIAAKRAEAKANKDRIQIEEAIVALTGKRDEGSQTHAVEGFKITVTGKVTRKMDWDKWETIKSQIPLNLHPIKTKLELDETGVKYLQSNEPEIYALLPIEVKPAKTGIEVKATDA